MVHRTFSFLLFATGLLGTVSAQNTVEAYVETKSFFDPAKGPYVDVNMAVLGSSVKYAEDTHGFQQAALEALTIVERDGAIIDFRKTAVHGPARLDSIHTDFIHQEEFSLAPGEYSLSIELRDVNSADTTVKRFKGPLAVPGPADGAWFSDVLLVDPTSTENKTIPYISTYYPSNKKQFIFYTELYGTDKVFGTDSLFLLTYEIENYEDRSLFGAFRKMARTPAAAVIPVSDGFDISKLPSGNYLLAVEARDRKGQVVKRKELFFQRNNPLTYDLGTLSDLQMGATFVDAIMDKDSLAEDIRCLRPIAGDLERKMIDDRWKDRDMDLMRRFFYSFWFNRNSYDPELAWKKYKQEVIKVNQLYGCRIKQGYDTDRGYVHLKYGPPNTIVSQANDADGYPYQIWHYYRVGKYSNKRFVFYLPDRVTECYELLHSEVPGEISNPNWNQMIHAANTPMNNVQDISVPQGHGQEVQDQYDMPH